MVVTRRASGIFISLQRVRRVVANLPFDDLYLLSLIKMARNKRELIRTSRVRKRQRTRSRV